MFIDKDKVKQQMESYLFTEFSSSLFELLSYLKEE